MGTDIHGVFQKRTQEGWEDIASTYEQNRHYQLFAVLAGVRNGSGFAGVPTGDAVTPIADPRGLPEDFHTIGGDHPITKETATKWELERLDRWPDEYPNGLSRWMGDHSFSWLSGPEMLGWKPPIITQTGVLSREGYEAWDKVSRPESYSGGVWGKGVLVVDESDKDSSPDWTHIQVRWPAALGDQLGYFFDEVRSLSEEHGDIRFVFGFDS